jgi:transcription factor 1
VWYVVPRESTPVRLHAADFGYIDDVLKYMSPTLEKYKGCDILDINPGACLWTQKLHDFLQPRSHVLLEPSPEIFKNFLDPLLDAPGSKYKLIQKDPTDLQSYRDIVDEGAFPQQTRVDPTDPEAQEANNTLLVTGSMVWDPVIPGLGFDSMAKQMYYHFTNAAWSNDLFHAYGLARTLFWMQNEDVNPMVAQASAGKHKGNQLLDMTQDMSLVVQSAHKARAVGRGAPSREPQYEMESLVRALQSGRENGMDVPPHRREISYEFAKHVEESSGGTGISRVNTFYPLFHRFEHEGKPTTGWMQGSFIDFVDAQKQLTSIYPDLPVDPYGTWTPLPDSLHNDADILSFRRTQSSLNLNIQNKRSCEVAADIGEQMYVLECKALGMEGGPEKDALVVQIEELDRAWDQALAKIPANYQGNPPTEVDDRLNLRYPPESRLQWDRRPFEPLLFREDEAWPRNRLCLITASPKPKPVGDSEDWHQWALDFVHALFSKPAIPLLTALSSMQHGLSAIIDECPSLTDPDKGGRMQLKHFRVRMLTEEMIYELVRAYKNWPFKAPGTDHDRYFRNNG